MFKKLIKILVLGLDMKDCLINLGAPKEKIIVHHLGVDCRKFKRQKGKIPRKKIYFSMYCKFCKKKGLEKLIDAFANLKKSMIMYN